MTKKKAPVKKVSRATTAITVPLPGGPVVLKNLAKTIAPVVAQAAQLLGDKDNAIKLLKNDLVMTGNKVALLERMVGTKDRIVAELKDKNTFLDKLVDETRVQRDVAADQAAELEATIFMYQGKLKTLLAKDSSDTVNKEEVGPTTLELSSENIAKFPEPVQIAFQKIQEVANLAVQSVH